MRVTVSHTETNFDRASRTHYNYEVTEGFSELPNEVTVALAKCARQYRVSKAEMVKIALLYYFGDGLDHFSETLPLLDKGSVVVGLPVIDQGKCKGGEDG